MLPFKPVPWAVFVGWVLAGLPAVVSAQCTTTYSSLESRIGLAEGVYYGSIADWKRTVIVPRHGMRKGNPSTIPDGVVRYDLTVQVDEVLKGAKCPRIRLVTETSDYDKRFEQWAERKSTFLFFVDDPEKAEGQKPSGNRWPSPWTYLRLEKRVPAEESYKTDTPPIFSKDGTVLDQPTKILTRARDFAKRHPKKLKVHTFTIPRATAELCSPSCDANFLVVPIEPALEITAKRMLASPGDFTVKKAKRDKLARHSLRLAGVGALRYFPSAENEELLESLLSDPTSHLVDNDFGQHKGKRVRKYPIREEAWTILKSWDRNIPQPVTEEVVPTTNGR